MTEEMHNRIEDYLSGAMNREEASSFESDLQTDTELKQAFDEYKLISEAIEVDVEDKLKARLKELDMQEMDADQKTSFNKWWILATVLVGLVIIALSIWKQTNDIKPQQIAQQYGVEENIDIFRNITSTEVFSEEEQIYIDKMKEASKQIEQENYQEARAIYESLNDEIPIIRDNKEWAIALTHYLESGRKNAIFQEILDKILKTPAHNCYKQAVQVEAEVNSFWGRLKN